MAQFSKLLILVGTMTGNAEYTAQAVELACSDALPSRVLRMDGLDTSVFADPSTLYLICTSTYGAGDVPDNAQALYAALDDMPRDLSAVRYGVLALGDASYTQTFANGGRRFDERLSGLGAQRLGDVFVHDATSGEAPEEVGAQWAQQWLGECLATGVVHR